MADVVITPSSVVPPNNNNTVHLSPANLIAGEVINAGEVACVLASDGKLYKADADDANKRDVRGFAANSAVAAGQRLDVIAPCPLLAVGAHGVAVGTPLFLSNTAGKICPYADLASGSLPILVAYTASATALQVIVAKATTAKP